MDLSLLRFFIFATELHKGSDDLVIVLLGSSCGTVKLNWKNLPNILRKEIATLEFKTASFVFLSLF